MLASSQKHSPHLTTLFFFSLFDVTVKNDYYQNFLVANDYNDHTTPTSLLGR